MVQKKITVKLIKGLIGQRKTAKDTVRGLGLRKINSTKDLIDTPSVRGMVNKISHLVTIIERAE